MGSASAAAPRHDTGVTPAPGSTATHAKGFGLKVALEPYRVERKTTLGRGFCFPRFEHPDTIVSGGTNEISWYHWNHINTTYQNDTMANQGVDPAANPHLADIFTHRAFGGTVKGAGLSGGGLVLGRALPCAPEPRPRRGRALCVPRGPRPTTRLDLSGPLSRKRLAFSSQAL